jgi:hypothetical protein
MTRRKRFRRSQRLQSARSWLETYDGENVVKAYRKRYGVDWPTAFEELEILGVEIDPAYKEAVLRTVQREIDVRREKQRWRRADQERAVRGWDQDDRFAVIIGHTSGGAPYGLTWEEWEDIAGTEDEE